MESGNKKILIVEPFYGGSHKKMIDIICSNLNIDAYYLITMKAKKWHWRARTSALYISTQIPLNHTFRVLFCTSVLPLAELIGLRPDLAKIYKVIYFHENQLEFPVRITKERDFQYGFNEILTCLVADKVLFNSNYNQDSFLSHINHHLKIQPDYRTKDLDLSIRSKCCVVYYPLDIQSINMHITSVIREDNHELYIVWPHRWEFDKNPDTFFRTLCKLNENGYEFKASILGESFSEKPDVFIEISSRLGSKLAHCGYVDNPAEYYKILKSSDVVVSTAIHEFFGVSVLEAVYCGCIPVVPNRLAYQELYSSNVDETYDTEAELYHILSELCTRKLNGGLKKDYRHLALPFEAKRWCSNLMELFHLKI